MSEPMKSECCGQGCNGDLQRQAQQQDARVINCQSEASSSYQHRVRGGEETGRCVADRSTEQQLQQAVGLTLSSKPFSFTICCAWSAMLEASMPYTCAAPTCSQAGVRHFQWQCSCKLTGTHLDCHLHLLQGGCQLLPEAPTW